MVILELIGRAPNNHALGMIGAGPLEDLVNGFGRAFEARILDHAARDRRFRVALADVSGKPRRLGCHGPTPRVGPTCDVGASGHRFRARPDALLSHNRSDWHLSASHFGGRGP